MKLAAIVTVLLGALGILGTIGEWVAGSRHGATSGTYRLAIVLGVLAFATILGAGVAILLGKRQEARPVLAASLVMAVAARLLFPWMGIAAQLVGIGLPVALLIALYWPRKASTLGAA